MATPGNGRPTLRERRRQDLTTEIKDVARRHLATDGLAALSLRAVARDVGMAVSAVYRYFASRDELITALLEDAYTAHADAVEAAVRAEPDPVAGLRAGLLAFREWSVAHPHEYGLMYGNPLPGYVAPPDRLFAAGTRIAALVFRTVGDAARRGELDAGVTAARRSALPAGHLAQLDEWRSRRVPELDLDTVAVTVDLWTRLHGLLTLEMFGQLRPVVPDPAAYYAGTLDDALREAGFARSRS